MENTDDPAVEVFRPDAEGPFVFVCEHASKWIPSFYNNLGASQEVIESHSAWDIGALALSKALSDRFDSPLVASKVSRLVYDCNRDPASSTAIVTRSENDDVPGNLDLSEDQRQQRVATVYQPFSDQLSSLLDHRLERSTDCSLVTIHSFTPIMHGKSRSVQIGVLHDSDSRFSDLILESVTDHPEYHIERNQPYGPDDDVTHTLTKHAIPRRLDNVMLEVRNDLLKDDSSVSTIAELLFGILSKALHAKSLNLRQTRKG